MSTLAISENQSDAALLRDRKAMLMYPVIVTPFVIALFYILGGGKGERYLAEKEAAGKPGAIGFNAFIPNAKSGTIEGRSVDRAAYGKATVGQTLSSFTNSRKDSSHLNGFKTVLVSNTVTPAQPTSQPTHTSSLAAAPVAAPMVRYAPVRRGPNAAALAATGGNTQRRKLNAYLYTPPGTAGYNAGTDQQVEARLKTYESQRNAPTTYARVPPPTTGLETTPQPGKAVGEEVRPASVRVSDNLTASQLTSEATVAENPFVTAPTGANRRGPQQAILSGGSNGSKRTISWMIPVVVHEDQTFRAGEMVKLRLLKEITADGVIIPVNTILHAVCQNSEDRMRLTVQSLQLEGQLIPLDLEVYDMDGTVGVNMPGMSNQAGGQIRSSAIQGVQMPGIGSLANTVMNTVRQSASARARQTSVKLRAGYNLFLKAQ